MYYICKFFESWSVFDGLKKSSRIMTKEEVDSLKSVFPGLLSDTKTLVALQVTSINPNKLVQLTTPDISKKDKKPEFPSKT